MNPEYQGMRVSHISHMGGDLNVVNAARVSFSKVSKELGEKDFKLIQYLAKNGHWSPFAHTSVSLRCSAPMFVARQLAKHKIGADWNEESRRYIDNPPTFYAPKKWRGRAKDKKQGSSDEDLTNTLVNSGNIFFTETPGDVLDKVVEHCFTAYDNLIETGVAPEQARMVLPQNAIINWIWTGSVVFFARVYNQRTEEHAQEETREFAERLSLVVKNCYPESWLALTGED